MSKQLPQLVRYLSEEGESGFAVFDSLESANIFLDKITPLFDWGDPEWFRSQFTLKEITSDEANVLANLFPEENHREIGALANFSFTDFWLSNIDEAS